MLSKRIAIPIAGALLCAAGFLGFLWWQLNETGQSFRDQMTAMIKPIALSGSTISPIDSLIDAKDATLLHMRRGDLLALRGNWEEAAQEYKEAVDAGGGLPALRKLLSAQLQRRDTRAARSTLDAMRREGAKREDLLLLESIMALREGKSDEAQGLLGSMPDSPQKSYGLALLAITQNQHDTASTLLQEVVAGWEPILRTYARTLLAAYEEYAAFPESPVTHLTTLVARSLAEVQECELAIPMLQQVNQFQADYRDAWILQGYCELMTERGREALVSLERAYAIDPVKPEIQYFLGRAYMEMDDLGNAATFMGYALRNGFEPKSEVRRQLVDLYIKKGDPAAALDQLDALTSEEGATVETYSDFVRTALSQGKKDEAILKATDATQKWNADARTWNLLGWAQLEAERKDEARASLQRALELDPSNEEAKQNLAKL